MLDHIVYNEVPVKKLVISASHNFYPSREASDRITIKEAEAYKGKYEELKGKVEEGMPPPSVDYSAMNIDGDNHPLDEAAKQFRKKFN